MTDCAEFEIRLREAAMRTDTIRGIVLRACGSAIVALATGFFCSALAAPPGNSIVLFTPREAHHLRLTTNEWEAVAMPRALSVGPQIIVRRPKTVPGDIPTIETQSPTDLDVVFEPRDAPVRMDSLNVEARKGFFSKPLTAMLRPYIRGDSIEMSQVKIPTGRFMLDISIADTSGNITDTTYRLEVGGK
jgi:hypothetical protein